MIYLGIDGGTYAGLCYFDTESKEMMGRSINFPLLRGYQRMAAMQREVRRVISLRSPDVIFIESMFVNRMASGDTEQTVIGMGTAIRLTLFDLGLMWYEVKPTVLKKWLTGHGSAKKPAMALAMKERYGYTSPSDDIVDAAALSRLAAETEIGAIGTSPKLKGISPGW